MIALTGTLEKDTALQVGFVFFLSNTKNRENLVASLRSITVQEGGGGGGGMRCKCSAGPLPLPFPPTIIFPVALPVSHYPVIGVDKRHCKCTVNLSQERTQHNVSGQGSHSDNSSRSPVL